MGKGGNLAPLEFQKAKFNLAPNESKIGKKELGASIDPSKRVNHHSKGIFSPLPFFGAKIFILAPGFD